MNIIKVLTASFVVFYAAVVEAYIGPGLGLGTIATVLGIFFGLVLFFVGLIWYPIKTLIKKFRK